MHKTVMIKGHSGVGFFFLALPLLRKGIGSLLGSKPVLISKGNRNQKKD